MTQSELPTQVAQKSYGDAIILLPSALGIAAQGLGGPLSLPCLCLPPGVIQILSFIVCAVECESLGSIVKILTEILHICVTSCDQLFTEAGPTIPGVLCFIVNPFFKVRVLEKQPAMCLFVVFSANSRPRPPAAQLSQTRGDLLSGDAALIYSLPLHHSSLTINTYSPPPGKA